MVNQSNNNELDEIVRWAPESMLEVSLQEPDDFLKTAETLTRIGIESKREKKLFQSCHILHKKGRYYLLHFKELFMLDGKVANFTVGDLCRRNTIAMLLSDWGLIDVVNPDQIGDNTISMRQIKVLPYAEKKNFELIAKYTIGRVKKNHN